MEKLKTLVADLSTPEKIEEAQNYAVNGLNEKKLQPIELVEALQFYLVNPTPTERAIGTKFLADILYGLSDKALNKKEVDFVTAFFVDRLKDHHSVVPNVIYAAIAMAKQCEYNDQHATDLLRAIFLEIHCQSQIMTDRNNIYSFIKDCLINRINGVKSFESEFLVGFISAMDGEKDPRNLLLLFSFIPHITQHLSINNYEEDLFEVVATYFPIDYVPPLHDPYEINPKELSKSLHECLSCTSKFAPYCLPLLEEKLNSDLVSAKIDALHVLQSCAEKYPADSLIPHLVPLWHSLRREVVFACSAEVDTMALGVIETIIATLLNTDDDLCITNNSAKDSALNWASSAMMECLPHLSTPEQRMLFPSSSLLLALCSKSQLITKLICQKVFPLLVAQLGSKTESKAQRNTLIILVKFIKKSKDNDIFNEEPQLELLSQVMSCLETVIKSDSQEEVIICGLLALQQALPISSNCHILTFAPVLCLLAQVDKVKISNTAIDCLKEVGNHKMCVDLQHQVLYPVFNTFIQSDTESNAEVNIVAHLSCNEAVLPDIVPSLWKQIKCAIVGEMKQINMLRCLCKISEISADKYNCMQYLCNDWNGLLRVTLFAMDIVTQQNNINAMQQCNTLATLLLIGSDLSVIGHLLELLFGENCDGEFIGPELQLNREELDCNWKQLCHWKQHDVMIYALDPICNSLAIRRSTEALTNIIDVLYHWTVYSAAEDIRIKAAYNIAVIINVTIKDNVVSHLLMHLKESLNSVADRQTVVIGWVTKALIMRGHKEEKEWVEKLESLLLNEKLGWEAAQCYQFILQDHPISFKTQNGAIVRLLYKQRFFENRIPILLQLYKTASEAKSSPLHILLAVSYMLPALPSSVLSCHFQNLLPVLLQCLDCNERAVVAGTLQTLQSLLQQSLQQVIAHTSTLVRHFLNLSTNAAMKIRLKALECLELLAGLPTVEVMPYKSEVLHKLKYCLNDQKRLCRNAATAASCTWDAIADNLE